MTNYNSDTSSADTRVVVGLDVHKDSIAVCVYDPPNETILLEKTIANQPAAVRKLIRLIRSRFAEPRCCYEASSCGFVLLRQLATLYAAGLLTSVDVPDPEQEATRALLRCRQALVDELTRTKHRVTQFLQTRGLAYREGTNWSRKFWLWLARIQRDSGLSGADQIVLGSYLALIDYLQAQIQAQIQALEADIEREAEKPRYRSTVQVLGAFRGVATFTALTLAAELGDIRRFAHPRQLMAYLGLVPSEHTSAGKTRPGAITKAGNRHARQAIVSAAWKYAARPRRSHPLQRRQAHLPPAIAPRVVAISWKAQQRLYKRFHALAFRKPRSVAATAVARELAGFLWEALQPVPARTEPGAAMDYAVAA